MLDYNPVTKKKGECIVVGRAATALYLILLELKKKGEYVIVPANICYAAVFPILSAGLKPVFCDVDKYSGNVTLDTVSAVLCESVVAAIIPHMYGNPVISLRNIKEKLSEKNIVLIEDCASLMTNENSSIYPGTIGDYVVYSTGYSKTIDNGIGGLLFSSYHSLQEMEKKEKELPLFKKYYDEETILFSKIYRVLRNHRGESQLVKDVYHSLLYSFKDNFIFSLENNMKKIVLNSINNLTEVEKTRRAKYVLYKKYLSNMYKIYKYESYAVPWRFNLYINNRDAFIKYCLDNSLPVSDWYPCVTPIFGETEIFINAFWHEQHIINFPLMINDDEILRICEILNNYKGDGKSEES